MDFGTLGTSLRKFDASNLCANETLISLPMVHFFIWRPSGSDWRSFSTSKWTLATLVHPLQNLVHPSQKIWYIIHDNIFKMHFRGSALMGSRPCLHSHAILGVGEVQFLTLMPTTGSSWGYFPRLPTLMPWPGPQVTLWILICSLSAPIETQSSPVSMVESVILIPEERPMWIPSVLRLSSSALIATL